MSRSHLAPHIIADWLQGRLSESQAVAVSEHVGSCNECAGLKAKLSGSLLAMSQLAKDEPPDLKWDQIGASAYWAVSSEKRAQKRSVSEVKPARPQWLWGLSLGLTAMAAAAALFFLVPGLFSKDSKKSSTTASTGPNAKSGKDALNPVITPVVPALAADSAPLQGLATFAQGEVWLDDAAISTTGFDGWLKTGSVVRTDDGRVTVQIDSETGFSLAPHSSVSIVALSVTNVELAVQGSVSFAVHKRTADQRFAVTAGTRQVLVRGTKFRVENQHELHVACEEGKVEVVDPTGAVFVSAGQYVKLLSDAVLAHAKAAELSPAELLPLSKSVTMPFLPAWSNDNTVVKSTAKLNVKSEKGVRVKVDGVEIGDGSFMVRVMSGRHLLEREGASEAGQWIEATAGAPRDVSVESEIAKIDSDNAARKQRKKQLTESLVGNHRARRCLDSLQKQGLVEGSYVDLEIGVNADGSFRYLNVQKSNVSADIQECLHHVVTVVELPPGPAAVIHYHWEF